MSLEQGMCATLCWACQLLRTSLYRGGSLVKLLSSSLPLTDIAEQGRVSNCVCTMLQGSVMFGIGNLPKRQNISKHNQHVLTAFTRPGSTQAKIVLVQQVWLLMT